MLLIKEAQVTDVPANTRLLINDNKYCVVINGTVIVKGAQTKQMCERSIFRAEGLLYSGEEGCRIIVFREEQLPENIRQKIIQPSITENHTENRKEPQSDTNSLFYDKKVSCPVCGTSFNSRQIRFSKLKLIKQDPDLRMHYQELDPLLYNVTICPECSYANLTQDFDKISSVRQPLNLNAEKGRSDNIQLTEVEMAVENYLLVLQCLEKLGSPPDKLARIYLYLAWLYEDSGNETKGREMRLEALTYYKQAYSTSSAMDSSQIHQITYLIAELSSQLGNKKDAYNFFQLLIREKDAAPWLVKLARERLYDLRKRV